MRKKEPPFCRCRDDDPSDHLNVELCPLVRNESSGFSDTVQRFSPSLVCPPSLVALSILSPPVPAPQPVFFIHATPWSCRIDVLSNPDSISPRDRGDTKGLCPPNQGQVSFFPVGINQSLGFFCPALAGSTPPWVRAFVLPITNLPPSPHATWRARVAFEVARHSKGEKSSLCGRHSYHRRLSRAGFLPFYTFAGVSPSSPPPPRRASTFTLNFYGGASVRPLSLELPFRACRAFLLHSPSPSLFLSQRPDLVQCF